MPKDQLLIVIFITCIIFILSSFAYTNNICCMFVSIRSYGFPGQYLIISKETDSWEEANKINTLSTQELLRQGWKVKFEAPTESRVSSSAVVNLLINLALWFTISFVIVKLVRKSGY